MSRAPEPASGESAGPLSDTHVLMGEIKGVRGIRGELRIHSWTRPPERILTYPQWTLVRDDRAREANVVGGRWHGRHLVVHLEGVTDRDTAEGLVGSQVRVAKAMLPRDDESFYWFELTGLTVETVNGEKLGQITGLMETGAHDVLVVAGDRERLIPYTPGVHVRHVDLAGGRLVADWEPGF